MVPRDVGFIRAAVGCVCAVGLSCAVCVLAMWLQVWLQDDHDTSRRTLVIPVVNRSSVCVLAMWLQVWLQDDHDTSRRTRVIPVVNRSNSPYYIFAFGAVEAFIILSVLGLHVNLIQIGSKPFLCTTILRK